MMYVKLITGLSLAICVVSATASQDPRSTPDTTYPDPVPQLYQTDIDTNKLAAILNRPDVQSRILTAMRHVVIEKLREEGVDVNPDTLARIAAVSTRHTKSPADTLAAGAVLIAVIGVVSDLRLKENIRHIGQSHSGLNIYEFSYKGYPTRWRGVIAQDLMETRPDAVYMDRTGFYVVDYSKIDVNFEFIGQ